ncbi:MAG TPA: adenylyl-sulfate kinase [Bryobacteraceae bacterium]|nr:adenylyl-sulfate kinase [Bryobacteraceae bacterium]
MQSARGFAIWLTGLPASGKSSVARALAQQLESRGVDCAVLESDELRKILTPHPRYDEEEREDFYRQMGWIGALLARHGVAVVFDATAHRRRYRERARQEIAKFLEVYVECPLEVCMARDPKGIYRAAGLWGRGQVPGLQAPYEPPLEPDVWIRGDRDEPDQAARQIMAALEQKGYL